MKSKAYGRYYEKNKETLKTKMRERARAKRAEQAELIDKGNVEAIKEAINTNRLRYAITCRNRIEKKISAMLADPTLDQRLKDALEVLKTEDAYRTLSMKTLNELEILFPKRAVVFEQTLLML